MITLGIDVGTSGVKAVLADVSAAGLDQLLADSSAPLTVQRPHAQWSEQAPEAWWHAVLTSVDALKATHAGVLASCSAIGLSGQMHGATLLDSAGEVLRPCMLWNDGRSALECQEFEDVWPASREVTGNLAMPGFTAPKLLWVRKHEPTLFDRVATVLLPKAYVRWRLCGEMIEERSDASGTLWLDVAARQWSDAALAATGLTTAQMPRLVEGSAAAGQLSNSLAQRWGMTRAPLIAGGAGDNAAGAVAVGAVSPGDAFVSLGTSGVLWCTTGSFAPNTAGAVHTFCHAIPDRWHQMGVLLSAASALSWWAGVTGESEGALLAELQPAHTTDVSFAPYLSGERTPHNDTTIRAGFVGLDASHSRADMTQAVLEGVAYAMRDAQLALAGAGTVIDEADLLGGGTRSARWCQLMADVLGIPLHRVMQSEIGCAMGAARLAAMAAAGGSAATITAIATRPERLETFAPNANDVARHRERHARWQSMYPLSRAFRTSMT